MPTIRNTELLSLLKTQVATEVSRADADSNGIITTTEQKRVAAHVKDDVAAYRRSVGGALSARAFVSDFEQRATSQISRADANRDAFLSETEQRSLPAALRNNIAKLSPGATPLPTTPTSAAFGITGTIPSSRVELRSILAQGLRGPTAVAQSPHDGSIWIVNGADDSSVVIDPRGQARKFYDQSAHFMNNPMAIAFSRNKNEFATVQDTDNTYNGHHAANMFMGPTLWTADRSIYQGSTESHLDMLHHSPNAMGIAAGPKVSSNDPREYWVFNGSAGSLDRYRFHQPHALGADDHADGETVRYATGQFRRVAGVPGHMALDTTTKKLFIADTGNGRIAVVDTSNLTMSGTQIPAHHAETTLLRNTGAVVQTLTPAGSVSRPAGLILKDGNVVVSDHATGHIKVFSTSGELKGDLDTGLGANALTGLAEVNGKLYALDAANNRLLEVTVRP